MRRSGIPRRLVAVVVLSALVGGTLGLSGSALARDPSSSSFVERLGLNVEGGDGILSGSGTRGMVDPKTLPEPSKAPSQRPTKPSLSRPTSTATAPTTPDVTGGVGPPDPVEISLTGSPPAGQPGFDGFSLTSGPATAFQPPDPWVAVGPDHVIQTVNTSMQILDRSGNLIEEADLADFFLLPPGYGLSDPRVIFDALHQRWVMTELSWICLAGGGGVGYIDYLVSSTADPTDPWRLDFLQFTNFLPDYPAPGTSSINVAFAINAFAMDETPGGNCLGAGTTYAATDILFVDWAEIVRPPTAPATNVDEFPFPAAFFTARVAVQTPATSPTLQAVVQVDDGIGTVQPFYVSFEGSVAAGTLEPTAASALTEDGIVAEWTEPPDPEQPGTPVKVTTRIDSRPTDAIWQDNKLTWVSTHGCTPSGDLSQQACQRVTQIDTTGTFQDIVLPTAVQDFLIAGADQDNYYGGIGQALDGTLHVSWTRSSVGGIYPSSYTAYQLPGDPDHSLSPPELLKAGVGPSFTGARWGDYNGVAQDPQVPNAVWQANMYSGGGSLWKTFISQLQTGGSTYVPITPVRVLDTRPGITIGLAGVFSHGVARSWTIAGFGGGTIPANAIAVSGNLTVANQTAGGYVSVTPTSNNNPSSSTINFPLGDTRANNLTIPVNAANGKISAVYRASAGKTTHLIFDVTGYFIAGGSEAEYTTITPVRALDTRPGINIGLAGAFQKNVPRKLSIGPEHVPAAAVAITGNLTVVGQTGAGFLSITPNSDASPETSNLNFPLGDVRANGFFARLNNQDDLWIVYETTAAGARSAHVLLDVTGYFVNDPSGLRYFPLTPGRVMDTRAGVVLSGLTGAFGANTPRRLDVAGHWGVPAGANAITGNLTVVNQTAAGYVSATLASDPDPDTSVLNFPLGDTRANGAALPLNGTGRSWFVYKAAAGKTTHLIFDLSGYFD